MKQNFADSSQIQLRARTSQGLWLESSQRNRQDLPKRPPELTTGTRERDFDFDVIGFFFFPRKEVLNHALLKGRFARAPCDYRPRRDDDLRVFLASANSA